MIETTPPKSLHEVLLRSYRNHPDAAAFVYRAGGNEFTVPYHKFFEDVLLLSRAFATHNIRKGDRVLLLADNRYAWIVTDFALIALGAISVPRGSDAPTRELEYILEHSGCSALIVETHALLDRHAALFEQYKRLV